MEKENFHDNLTALYKAFGEGTVFISLHQAAKYCKRSPVTLLASKGFPLKKLGERDYSVSVIGLARWLS